MNTGYGVFISIIGQCGLPKTTPRTPVNRQVPRRGASGPWRSPPGRVTAADAATREPSRETNAVAGAT